MRRTVLALVLSSIGFAACTLLGDRLDGISDGNHCKSGKRDGDETGIDCGGSCGPCTFGNVCHKDSECATGACLGGECGCPDDMVLNIRPSDSATFCIDAHEVTAKQYGDYLADCAKKGGCSFDCDGPWKIAPPVSDSGNCTPDKYDPTGNLPVVCVHLCDALAYCAAHGRRLCDNFTGDSVPPSGFANPSLSEWYNACSNSGQLPYSYESDGGFDPQACNGSALGKNAPVPVGSQSGCGHDEIFDMSGNVWEWEDAYTAGDECILRGGSFRSDQSDLSCASAKAVDCASFDDDIGFRCCSG